MARSRAQKQAYWRRMLRRQGQSGLSGRQFCSTHQLSEASFYYWKRKFADLDGHERGSAQAEEGVRPGTHAGTVGGISTQAKAGSSASAPTKEALVPKDNGLRRRGTRPKEGAPVFIPVHVNAVGRHDRGLSAGGGLEVVHPRGCVVRVPPVVDENVLRQVLGVLDGQRLA